MASEEIRNPNIEILNKSQTQNSNVQNFFHAGFTLILHERIYFAGSDSAVMTQRLDKNLLNFGFRSFGFSASDFEFSSRDRTAQPFSSDPAPPR